MLCIFSDGKLFIEFNSVKLIHEFTVLNKFSLKVQLRFSSESYVCLSVHLYAVNWIGIIVHLGLDKINVWKILYYNLDFVILRHGDVCECISCNILYQTAIRLDRNVLGAESDKCTNEGEKGEET